MNTIEILNKIERAIIEIENGNTETAIEELSDVKLHINVSVVNEKPQSLSIDKIELTGIKLPIS